MMINVEIRVKITESGLAGNGQYPTELVYQHQNSDGGSNPRFYGDVIQRNIDSAATQAIRSLQTYVDLRDTAYPTNTRLLKGQPDHAERP